MRYIGAEPVFIDSDPLSWNMDASLLAEELRLRARRGRLPAAVISVDLLGGCPDYETIEAACAEFDVPLVEDAAEALGASYGGRPAGSFGVCADFFFNGNKILTTSGGGMLVSRSAELVAEARFLASQAREPSAHYEHEQLGYNYRLSNLLAALGRGSVTRPRPADRPPSGHPPSLPRGIRPDGRHLDDADRATGSSRTTG